ncbi:MULTISPECIES: DUF3332 domain-containing protein [Persicobacter]|uniref:Membrane protein n=1 Tax=Persicobacter diffluens TaxID=981 RepID=A0AAN4VZA6_9BACT|nr:DUF3332 domain-containing protein [Persicobacter sp. CCB-QB2]GJM61698.1 membrane protein [Persicobacter diffluens]
MKKLSTILLAVFMMSAGLVQTSCYGPFKLTTKLWNWNGQVGDKFINALLFFGLNIIPVYGVTVFLDAIIFNSIEFWGGNNPISMGPGEIEERVVEGENSTYKLTASQNRYDIEVIAGEHKGAKGAFVFSKKDKSWTWEENGTSEVIMQMSGDENNPMIQFLPETAHAFSMNFTEMEAAQKRGFRGTELVSNH